MPIIPKEKLTAYQRWELASFEEPEIVEVVREDDPAEIERKRQEAEQVELLREQARQQGYAEGLQRGLEEGREQGRMEGLRLGRSEAADEVAALREVARSFGDEVSRANDLVADDLLTLSLDLAKAMLKTALKVRPELVLPVVAEAIRYLPSVQQPALLVLHPQDAEIVRTHLGEELEKAGWRIGEETQMDRGGCRVETASNQIDATPGVRWHRLADALGKQSDWIE